MLGNIALDVVIGLVFVYLLYSLYATVIMEMISSFLGLRGKNLAYALRRMLMDEKKYSNSFFARVSRTFTSFIQISGRATNLTNSNLYDKFFDQRSIKYLCSGGVNNKPSYLTPESFSKGILEVIKTKDPDLNTLTNILNGLDALPESEAKKHIESLLADANNDVMKFKILLEEWFNSTMDRASGWYKRSVQMILFITGLVLAILFNVDTIAVIKKLSTDREAREQLVKMATDFSRNNAELVNTVTNNTATPADSVTPSQQQILNRLEALSDIKETLNQDIEKSQNILASSWNISSPLHFADTKKDQLHKDSVQVHYTSCGLNLYLTVHKSVDQDVLRSMEVVKTGSKTATINTFYYKLSVVFSRSHFWGYFFTALAISLGSPFWFDLLNKLVKLKTSKSAAAAEESKQATVSGQSNKDILNTVG